MSGKTATFRYHGTGGGLFSLMLVNSLLTVITLGIYSFWARNKVREFHYAQTECSGDRFQYHGTGGELLRGGLKAFAFLFLLVLALAAGQMAIGGEEAAPAMQAALSVGFYAIIVILIPLAINGTRRYRLSRSSWRGIRFSYHGPAAEFMKLTIGGGILTILTLGFMGPYFDNKRRGFFVTNAHFGSEPFLYEADGRELFREYLKALLFTIPTLGIYWVWYAAFRHRYFWKHTAMRGARFHSSVKGGDLFVLGLTNALLAVFTLGIGMPWVMARTHAFWCDNLALVGTVDWATVHQQTQAANATAEGLADGLDIDVGIGM